MRTVAETLAWARQALQAGQWPQAESLCHQVLEAEPHNVDALHLLSVLAYQAGQPQRALAYIEQALTVRPHDPGLHSNRGMMLDSLHRWNEAVAAYQEAMRLRPGLPQVHNNLGAALQNLGRLDDAVASYREAHRLRPNYPEAHYNLGSTFERQGRLSEADACLREALRLRPNYPEAYNNLGNVFREQRRLDEAAACYREALRLRPNFAEAYNNLGNVFQRQGRLDEAVASYREALRLQPRYAEAYNNLGNTFKEQQRLDEAIACYQDALRLWPDFPEAHSYLGQTWLLLGELERGWAEYEWRQRCRGFEERRFSQPLWDGTPLGGQPILLYAELGLGDTLQFVRYAPLVQQRGGRVILECPPSLLPLLATCPGIDQVVAHGSPLPEFAVQAPLLSLPRILKTTLQTIPASVPYLHSDPARRRRWQQELQGTAAWNVGIAWQGNPLHRRDRERSVPLEQFAPLAQVAGVRLVRLQRGPGSEQLAQLGGRWAVFDPPGWPEDPAESWLETAALMSALNLVITVDSAVAHLAGALAVPVWVALPFLPDWRWLLEQEDSPWYPSMRLFRQQHVDDWPGVFARIADALQNRSEPEA